MSFIGSPSSTDVICVRISITKRRPEYEPSIHPVPVTPCIPISLYPYSYILYQLRLGTVNHYIAESKYISPQTLASLCAAYATANYDHSANICHEALNCCAQNIQLVLAALSLFIKAVHYMRVTISSVGIL